MTVTAEAEGRRTRDRNRGERILEVARQLFSERGYHAVSIDDIGTAAGITGPGVYRHFGGKEEILVAVLDRAAAEMWSNVSDEHGRHTIGDYVVAHVDWAVHNADLVILWHQERRNLPEDDWNRQRRIQRNYLARWVDALVEERPELDETEAWVMIRAVVGMIHSIGHYENILDRAKLREVLASMSMNALRAERPRQLEQPTP